MHIMKKTIAGDYIKIQNYTRHNIQAHKQPRKKRVNETIEAVKRYNDKLKADKLQMLMIMNFRNGFFITLKYPNGSRPNEYQEADKTMLKALRRIKRELQKEGNTLKYIAVTERGKRSGNLHHHIVVDSLAAATKLIQAWEGYASMEPIDNDGSFQNLASYLSKRDTKEELPKGKSLYHISRNLDKPTVVYEVSADKWDDIPKAPQGYEIIADSLKNGFNDVLGIKYQSYLLKRQINAKERKKDNNKGKKANRIFSWLHSWKGSRAAGQ